ncbi:MAG: hypothetical protein JWQ23_4574 [Herminiimonas sp.]|nr:hypothetical protein [Herminiimonas sp.]
MKKFVRRIACLILASLLTACIPQRMVKDRLDIIEDQASCTTRPETLIVVLPGLYDKAQDIVDQGFISALRQRNLAADIVVADAHIGYYKSGVFVERLHEDIIAPAKNRGYRQIWLAGISLGGYGSLLYAQQHSDLITGMVLMAPYLGEDRLLAEVAQAGGLTGWQAGTVDPADHGRSLWAWLKGYDRPPFENRQAYPPLYIGYGLEDRFADNNRMLAKALPESQVMTTEGGHDWQPWRRLWGKFLDRNTLPACV